MALSGTLTAKRIAVVQEGAQGIDLSGNQSLAVEYTTAADWAAPIWVHQLPKTLYAADGKPTKLGALELPGFYLMFPDVPPLTDAQGMANQNASFKGALRYRFLYRSVTRGNSHLPEARHKAEYIFGQVGYAYDRSKAKPEDKAPKAKKPVTTATGANNASSGSTTTDGRATPNTVAATQNTAPPATTSENSWTEVNGQLISSAEWNTMVYKGKSVELANSGDFRPATYRLQYTAPGSTPSVAHFIAFKGQVVQFENEQEALTCLQYLHDVLPATGAPAAGTFTIEQIAVPVNQLSLGAIKLVRHQH